MTLDAVRRGQRVTITGINDAHIRMQALRLGLGEGAEVVCEEIIPTGAIVISRHRQKIALGRGVAASITVNLEMVS